MPKLVRLPRSPVLRAAIALTVSFLLTACGSSDDGEGAGGDQVNLTVGTRSGRIELPAGAASPAALTVITSVGEATPAADGSFEVTSLVDGPQLAMLLGATGKVLLMGFLGDGQTALSPRTTAEVLAYFAIGTFMVPDADARLRVAELLRSASELDPLAQAIAAALVDDPAGLEDDAAVAQAVVDAVHALLGTSGGRGVVVNPGNDMSGVRINLPGVNDLQLTNSYRRRSHVFIDRVSYVPADGGEPVPAPEALSDFQLPPVSGVGSLSATIVDLILNNQAYTPADSEVIALPLIPQTARKTTYRVSVVGAGRTEGDLNRMTVAQQEAAITTALEQVVFDMFLPFVINVLAPNHASTQQILDRLRLGGQRGSLILGFTQAAPNLTRKVRDGDLAGAFGDAYNTFITDGTLRDNVLGAIFEVAGTLNLLTGGSQCMVEAGAQVMRALQVVDAVLQTFDATVMGSQLALSNQGDIWTVDVTAARVRLNPAEATIKPNELKTFETVVLEATGTDQVFEYRYRTTGTVGQIRDAMHGPSNAFTTSSEFVVFEAGDENGTDTVMVEVYALAGPGGSEREKVGEATSTVEVNSGVVFINPGFQEVESGEETTLTGRVDPAPDASVYPLTFRWTVPGEHGVLDGPITGLPQVLEHAVAGGTQDVVTYKADSRPEQAGTETVRLEVLDVNGNVLGQDQAFVKVGAPPRYIAFSQGFSSIGIIMPDGTGRRTLISGGGENFGAKWSPDGTKIAWTRQNTGGGARIFVANADGSGVEQLTEGRADYAPGWSHNGTRLAFQRTVDIGSDRVLETAVVDLATHHVTVVSPTDDGFGMFGTFVWLPDDSGIVSVAGGDVPDGTGGKRFGYFLASVPAGGGPVSILSEVTANTAIALDPDGSRFIVSLNGSSDQAPGLFEIPIGGGGPSRIQTTREGVVPPNGIAFSPDGEQIVYSATPSPNNWDLFVMPSDGGEAVNITNSSSDELHPDW